VFAKFVQIKAVGFILAPPVGDYIQVSNLRAIMALLFPQMFGNIRDCNYYQVIRYRDFFAVYMALYLAGFMALF
jgi:hypothetical protein